MTHTIIILNGVSSSGKTSIAKQLQKILLVKQQDLFLHVPIDLMWNMFPKDMEPNSINFPHMIEMYLKHVENLSHHHPLILDVVFKQSAFKKLTKILNGKAIKNILVKADMPTIEGREKNRSDRKIGLAQSQFKDLYETDIHYDLIVDTKYKTPDVLAQEIIDYFFLK